MMGELLVSEREAQERLLIALSELLADQGFQVVAAFGGHPVPHLVVLSVLRRRVGSLGELLWRNFSDRLVFQVVGSFGGFADHPSEVDLHIFVRTGSV